MLSNLGDQLIYLRLVDILMYTFDLVFYFVDERAHALDRGVDMELILELLD